MTTRIPLTVISLGFCFLLLVPSTGIAQIIQIISSTGDGTNALSGANGVAVDNVGNVYVTGRNSDNAFKITPGGTITEIINASGDGANSLDSCFGAATDAAGNVYVTGSVSNNAFKIEDPCGARTITQIISPNGDGHGNTLFAPFSLALDASGNVYVDGHTNALSIIDPCGANTIAQIISAMGDGTNSLNNARGIAVDAMGNVFVAGHFTDNVFRITPSGTITQIIGPAGDGMGNALDGPTGVAVDGSGNAYVTGQNSDNAFKITPGGMITQIIDATGDGAGNALDDPYGIAVDNLGNVYLVGVTSDNAFRITDPCGAKVITEIIDSTGDGSNPLDNPIFIAVDGSGNAYITGRASNNAFKISHCRDGNVNDGSGSPTDVLFVNGTSGGSLRETTIKSTDWLLVFVTPAPTTGLNNRYHIGVWTGVPSTSTVAALLANVGTMCFQPLQGQANYIQPTHVANTLVSPILDPSSTYATGDPLTGNVLEIPPGTFGPGTVLTVQGLIGDGNSTANRPISITNAIVVRVE